ncbi:Endonuclease/Exonuclease/phosphatase family protein [Stieleria neptunia]|uniref:Endonuclease/Exonuclease/phosphatase family protein n=1 Tax=Stieleria neptunia TaxID=2527979 RepID=A0A518HJD9_9BACT|nr:endonuclease/exonuclease/phosphatase family protein [Stieleria neptunia]QDV40943.1 Endonuclease/Exonuclease/phosphatase family protein [Stieleria neptunia]
MKRATLIFAILYLVLLIIGAAVMHSSLNSYWLVTLFLFSPRWVAALPLLLLVPLTLKLRWRWTPIYLIHAFVVLFPILGFQLPRRTATPTGTARTLRVLTCNVGGGTLDDRQLIQLIHDNRIDVLMLQECTQAVSDPLFRKLGWQRRQAHHVVIGSPLDLSEARVLGRHSENNFRAVAAIGCELGGPQGSRIQLVSVHLPTFRPALERIQHLDFDRGPDAIRQMGQLRRDLSRQIVDAIDDSELPTIVAGDFNLPAESTFHREFWNRFQNAFSIAGSGWGYTKYTRFHGVRIDHVLADRNWIVQNAHVGPDLGGDHRPVIAELARTTTP